jgi:hypothetical protein
MLTPRKKDLLKFAISQYISKLDNISYSTIKEFIEIAEELEMYDFASELRDKLI